ncbi:MAG: histidine kinase [Bacteroidota bacterium]
MDLVFWVSYCLFWHLVFAPEPLTAPNLAISGSLTFWQAVASYLHIRYLLEPRYVGRRSVPLYALGVLVLVLVTSVLSWACLYGFFALVLGPLPLRGFIEQGMEYWSGALLGGMVMAVAFTGAVYLFGRHREREKRERALEKARTEAELAYLRGQLNPHFLFNALNSIHVLIPRSPEEAQTALEGFSELLRYQLYRSEADFVPLREEIAQLRQFADLSRLRLEEDFVFDLRMPTVPTNYRVPPMLLLPLLENAFKYCPKLGGDIQAGVKITEEKLQFTLVNNVAENIVATESSGIGLSNIRRRLDILYPAAYRLETDDRARQYSVFLEIPLTA